MAIKVSQTLYREIERVKKLAKERNIDILDTKVIAELSKELNLGTLHLAILGNTRRYLACIKEGMDVDIACKLTKTQKKYCVYCYPKVTEV